MAFTNFFPTKEINVISSNNFKVIDGNPNFDVKYQKFNALEISKEYIKHTYREGWKLPDMPR